MKLLFASTNQGKIAEAAAIIDHPQITLIGLDQIDQAYDEVDETGDTFQTNSLLKAKYFAELTGLPTLADDSGLEVTALDGAPGVNSNRWHPGSDEDRNQALLNLLTDAKDRSAQFVTVACYYDPKTAQAEYFRGEIKGHISHEPAGTEGFGYDPIFIPEGHDQPFAALGLDVKNKLSHRSIAYKQCSDYLLEKVI